MLVYRFVTEGTIEEKIVERAESKLYLDALVIQQGRLVEKQKGLNKDDLLKMITFGADHIFDSNSDASKLTDKDIDEILSIGEKKTEELSHKLKANKMNLASFSLTEENSSLYTFSGVDYSANILSRAVGNWVGPGKRRRNDKEYIKKNTFFPLIYFLFFELQLQCRL